MTKKNLYLIGERVLEELMFNNFSTEEEIAIKKTRDVLARLYTAECISDIDYGFSHDTSDFLEIFSEEHISRIEAYNKAAEVGLQKFLDEQREKN